MLRPVDLSPEIACQYPGIVLIAGNMKPEARDRWFLEIRRALHDPRTRATQRDFDIIEALTTSFEMAQLAVYVGTSRQGRTKPR